MCLLTPSALTTEEKSEEKEDLSAAPAAGVCLAFTSSVTLLFFAGFSGPVDFSLRKVALIYY